MSRLEALAVTPCKGRPPPSFCLRSRSPHDARSTLAASQPGYKRRNQSIVELGCRRSFRGSRFRQHTPLSRVRIIAARRVGGSRHRSCESASRTRMDLEFRLPGIRANRSRPEGLVWGDAHSLRRNRFATGPEGQPAPDQFLSRARAAAREKATCLAIHHERFVPRTGTLRPSGT